MEPCARREGDGLAVSVCNENKTRGVMHARVVPQYYFSTGLLNKIDVNGSPARTNTQNAHAHTTFGRIQTIYPYENHFATHLKVIFDE